MKTLLLFAIILGTIAPAFSDVVFSQNYADRRRFLSLTQEEIDQQKVYDLKKSSLPLTLDEAGKIAVIEYAKEISHPIGLQRTQVDSVILRQYRAPTGHDDLGKYFYEVILRSVVSNKGKESWSFHTHWAVFPDRSIKAFESEKRQTEQDAAANP